NKRHFDLCVACCVSLTHFGGHSAVPWPTPLISKEIWPFQSAFTNWLSKQLKSSLKWCHLTMEMLKKYNPDRVDIKF
ncbi:hypothetical protein, partial [Enterobacter cloacae complex sp. 2DZ2F20B]|uniref:hypothetical protein n=1 Tax=Enterobacter cloacae complex sp. 2DZ2F20B TaxID=2511993 RepID=UPI001CA5CC46